jgi:hypothetical protein
MRLFYFVLFAPFLFSSCLVVKIYESPKEPTTAPKLLHQQHQNMIGSGKVIDLGERGTHEILFFGKEKVPESYFFRERDSVIEGKSELDSSSVWIQNGTSKRFNVVAKIDDEAIMVINGKISDDKSSMNDIDPEIIEFINVLKGKSAIEKYGDKGAHGVIEITTKKE